MKIEHGKGKEIYVADASALDLSFSSNALALYKESCLIVKPLARTLETIILSFTHVNSSTPLHLVKGCT